MHISLDSALGRQRRLNSVGESVFQIAPDAAAGYSLRSLTGGDPSVVRVRRESDNNERDFRSSEINSGGMVRWVNEQITPPLDLRELTATGRDGPIIEAAAAYSLRNLSSSYTGSVVDVRRDSDGNTESFTAVEVADGTLEDWVNEDVVVGLADTLSDFSTAKLNSSNATVEGEQCYKFVLDNQENTTHYSVVSSISFIAGKQYNLSFKYYIPAGQTVYRLNLNYGGYGQIDLAEGTGEWKQFNHTFTSTQTRELRIYASDYNISIDGDASGEFFALQDVTLTQVGNKDGTVSKWYDQSTTSGVPNANHAVQTSTGSQPKIVSGGTLVTGGLTFDGTNDFFQASIGTLTQPISGFSVFKNNSLLNAPSIWDSTSVTNRVISYAVASDDTFRISAGTAAISAPASHVDGTTYIRSDLINTTASEGYVNGTLKVSGNAGTNSMEGLTIGARYDGSANFTNGSIAEIIIYPSDQTDNRTALEANIGEVYGIGGIPAYDDSVNGFVETWYDQSGNGNDASQLTAGSQPKIVDAGVLVSDGIEFDGVDDRLTCSSLYSSDISVFNVATTSNTVNTGNYMRMIHLCDGSDSFQLTRGGSLDIGKLDSKNTAFQSGTTAFKHGDINGVHLISAVTSSTDTDASIDGSLQPNGSTNIGSGNNATTTIGARDDLLSSTFFAGSHAEIIIYPSDQSANRVAIEANINNQYDIY